MNFLTRSILALALLAGVAFAQTAGFVRPDVADLCNAAKRGDIKAVERLLDAGAPIDASDAMGQQPIVKAIKGGHHRVLLTLIKRGADPDTRTRNNYGSSALTMASESGDIRLVEALVNAGANPNLRGRSGATPLSMAAQNGHDDIAAYLLKHGADPNGWGSLDTLGRQYTPLFIAASNKRSNIVAMLLKKGAKIDQHLSNGDPAFTIAAAKTNSRVLKMLAAAGAKVDEPTPSGATPLIVAIEHSNYEAVQYLLGKGVDVTRKVSTYKGKPCTAREYAKTIGDRRVIAMVEAAAAKRKS